MGHADEVWWDATCAALGDRRRARTLRRVRERLQSHVGQSWSAALGSGLRQAAGDLVALASAGYRDMVAGDVAVTVARCAALPWVIASDDTCAYDFTSQRGKQGMGRLRSKGRGVWGHSVLALSPQGQVQGLLDTQFWTRQGPALAGQRRARDYAAKESRKWELSLERVQELLPPGLVVVIVSDRESDIYRYIIAPRGAHVHLLLRLTHPRRLADSEQDLVTTARFAPVVGAGWIDVPAERGRPARQACVQIRVSEVEVCSPRNGWSGPASTVRLWVIAAREENPPAGAKRLEWILASTRPVVSLADAWEGLRIYALRWQIEVLHRTLKKDGLRVERLQHKSALAVERALAIYQGVAADMLHLVQVARADPARPATDFLASDALTVLALSTRRPVTTIGQAVAAIAVLGGWPGHPRSPRPGVQVVSTGYHDLVVMVTGYRLARGLPHGPVCYNDTG
jgi:hypothetical protein